ncbi:MAG: 3-dehydroquinate synthase [Salibacteraceae bacterium]
MNDSLIITEPFEWKSWLDSIDYSKVLIITDHNTEKYCLNPFRTHYQLDSKALHTSVEPGEASKSIDQVQSLWIEWITKGIDRDALIIALGGGMLCDLVGFTASTFKRGVRCVYVPTTNLAMCDAAIGGKTGINFADVKNQIGTFQLPEAVLIDSLFLQTLPERQLRSGHVETAKHALISSNSLWNRLQQQSAIDLSQELILQSMRIKKAYVEKDFRDHGIRQALNFGHTVGHAVEIIGNLYNNETFHGEAVAFGLIAESWLSHSKLGLAEDKLTAIVNYLKREVSIPTLNDADFDLCLSRVQHDKKNSGGEIQCTLLNDIGSTHPKNTISPTELDAALRFTNSILRE